VGELGELLEEEVDGHDRDPVAVREVDALERRVALAERVDRLVRQAADADEADPPELGQARELEDGHVGEERAVWSKVSTSMI
jgi:hypothetical protein